MRRSTVCRKDDYEFVRLDAFIHLLAKARRQGLIGEDLYPDKRRTPEDPGQGGRETVGQAGSRPSGNTPSGRNWTRRHSGARSTIR